MFKKLTDKAKIKGKKGTVDESSKVKKKRGEKGAEASTRKKREKKKTEAQVRRKQTNERSTKERGSKETIDTQEKNPTVLGAAPPAASPEVCKWVQRALDQGVESLRNEYKALAKYTMPEMTIEAFLANHEAGRNRYQDVPCQDQDRVPLNRGPVKYIHANYVSTPRDAKRFICTQGPLDCTINEFWAMVVQENVSVIVMLCNTIELGKLKCAQYWPPNVSETMKFDAVECEVTNKEMGPMPNEPTIVTTKLNLSYKDAGETKNRLVTHHQWVDWPDRGVPPCRLTSMELLSAVRGSKFPIVVHCSAGIGRTGTIVAIEYILQRLQHNEDCAAMDELLKKLRHQRAFSIQNDLQYLYVHRVMLCYFLEKHKARYGAILTDENKIKYEKFIADYNVATGQTTA